MKKNFTTLSAIIAVFAVCLNFQLKAQVTVHWEENFTDQLADWTTVGLSAGNPVWTWDPQGDADQGAFWGGAGIASPTGSTGAAVFNSDYYDNGGDDTKLGQGPIPGPHISELISPTINLSGVQAATLEFYQYHRNFQADTYIAFSKDGGTSWSDPYLLNEDILTNRSTANPSKIYVPLFNNGGSANFKIKFIFDGNYYFWILDDLRIVSIQSEVALGKYQFYPPSSFAQPSVMIEADSFGFATDIFNYSSVPMNNVVAKVEVLSPSSQVLYKDSVVIANMPAASGDTIDFDNRLYGPTGLLPADYTIRYSIKNNSGNPDLDATNNTVTFPFRVTQNSFAKESRIINNSGVRPGGDYQMGNLYTISPNLVDRYKANSLSFSVYLPAGSGALAGKKLTMYLLQVNDDEVDADWNGWDDNKSLADNPGLLLKGFKEFTFATTHRSNTLITVPLEDLDGKTGVELDPGKRYIALIEYVGDANLIQTSVNQDLRYRFISTIIWVQDDGRFYLGGFGQQTAAIIRMTIGLITSTDDQPLPDNALTIFPNPVTDNLNLSIDLAETAPVANVTIADIAGNVLMIDELFNVQKENKTYNFSEYANGTYLVRLATEKGTKTMKVVVQK